MARTKGNDLLTQSPRLVNILSQVTAAANEERHDDALLLLKEAYQIFKHLPKNELKLLDKMFCRRGCQGRQSSRRQLMEGIFPLGKSIARERFALRLFEG